MSEIRNTFIYNRRPTSMAANPNTQQIRQINMSEMNDTEVYNAYLE